MATFWTGSGSNVSKCQVHILCSGLRMETSPLSVPVTEALGRRVCNEERRVIANQQLNKVLQCQSECSVHALFQSFSKPKRSKNDFPQMIKELFSPLCACAHKYTWRNYLKYTLFDQEQQIHNNIPKLFSLFSQNLLCQVLGFVGVASGKNLPANVGDIRDGGSIPGREDPLEEGMATHSSILAWRIPQTEEPSGVQSMGSQRVRQD